MTDVSAKGSMVTVGRHLLRIGVKGVLVSGGCEKDGRVPLCDRIDEITELVRTGLLVNIHTGLLDEDLARALADTGAQSFSVDVHASSEVIRETLHLDRTPLDFERTIDAMCAHAPGRVSPHILAGLEGDSTISEKKALRMLAGKELASVILLRHVRTRGAALDPRPPLSDDSFLELVDHAASLMDVPIVIGCMRPRPSVDLEVECVSRGASGIALPSSTTRKRLEALGHRVRTSDHCCALQR